MRAIMLTVAYDGTDYAGFQVQNNGPTIQGEIEGALSRLTSQPVRVTGAGRTDAGVHARGQTVGFRTACDHDAATYVRALNALLPRDIAVLRAETAPDDFHARYWATGKTYSYRIWTGRVRPVFERRYTHYYPHPLDTGAMRDGAALLVGRHDFAAFQAAGSSAGTSTRQITRLDVAVTDEGVRLTVEADGFLYHMVRIIAGTLIRVGSGKLAPRAVGAILESKVRPDAGPTAPPEGLCLEAVYYRRESGAVVAPDCYAHLGAKHDDNPAFS